MLLVDNWEIFYKSVIEIKIQIEKILGFVDIIIMFQFQNFDNFMEIICCGFKQVVYIIVNFFDSLGLVDVINLVFVVV